MRSLKSPQKKGKTDEDATKKTLFCGDATGTLLRTKLIRTKRWEGNGDTNGGGDLSNMFRGTAGIDYPDLKSIPNTNFKCSDQEYEGGLYADVEAQCQGHFSTNKFWHVIMVPRCERGPFFYYLNAQIGSSDTSWVPPQGNPQYNNQGSNYQLYNPNAANNGNPQSGDTGSGPTENGQKPCCCLKNNYVAPWNFPSH
ncbi:hypothetical protein HNY73_010336 [Argiope bruennichi]|uniref:Uncharacterized protein n=1 Tax=Argiope bruennichi TaxID=94029 RepID=A0A8T0F327_ARGBR|nr:hypothetical protein HNY73_010336 [Argiope bruennichi]